MEREDTISLIRSLLITKNGLYDYSTFLKDFQEETGHALPKFGYETHLDFLRSLPDTVQVKSLNHKICLVPVDNSKTSHIRSLVIKQGTLKCQRFGVKNHGLGKEISESFNKSHIPTRKKSAESFNVVHEVDNLRFNNNINVRCDRKASCNDVIVSLRKPDEPENHNNNWNHSEINRRENNLFSKPNLNPLGFSTNPEKFNKLTVNSLIPNSWKIPKLDSREHIKIGEYIEVCVPAVNNPFKFTIQLRKFRKKFIKLMEEMQSFYSKTGDNYRIEDSVLKKNDPCAVLYKSKTELLQWHRAEIIKFEKKFSKVLFVDSGVMMEVEKSNLRYLCRSFGTLPAQALKGHLANIQPSNGKNWSEQASLRFLDFVCKKDLIAGVVDVNHEEFWVSVALSQTGGEGVHINDALVAENLAVFEFINFESESSSLSGLKNENANENNITPDVLSYSEDNKRLQEMFGSV